jgi:hypothetical protein
MAGSNNVAVANNRARVWREPDMKPPYLGDRGKGTSARRGIDTGRK